VMMHAPSARSPLLRSVKYRFSLLLDTIAS